MDSIGWLLDKKKMRKGWHVCYTCMGSTGHDTPKSVFYSQRPPALVLGRPLMKCPRCGGTNTKSLQTLRDEGAETAAWGLERIVKKCSRAKYEFKETAEKAAS